MYINISLSFRIKIATFLSYSISVEKIWWPFSKNKLNFPLMI